MVKSVEQLLWLVKELERICERRRLKVNVKNKIVLLGRKGVAFQVKVEMKREITEVVSSFKYLGSSFSGNGAPQIDAGMIMCEGLETFDAMRMVNVKSVSLDGKRELYERRVEPTVVYGAET